MYCDFGYAEKAFGRACRVLEVTGKIVLSSDLPPLTGALGCAEPSSRTVWLAPYASYCIALHEVLHVLFPNEPHESIFDWSNQIAYGRGSATIVAKARKRGREL